MAKESVSKSLFVDSFVGIRDPGALLTPKFVARGSLRSSANLLECSIIMDLIPALVYWTVPWVRDITPTMRCKIKSKKQLGWRNSRITGICAEYCYIYDYHIFFLTIMQYRNIISNNYRSSILRIEQYEFWYDGSTAQRVHHVSFGAWKFGDGPITGANFWWVWLYLSGEILVWGIKKDSHQSSAWHFCVGDDEMGNSERLSLSIFRVSWGVRFITKWENRETWRYCIVVY